MYQLFPRVSLYWQDSAASGASTVSKGKYGVSAVSWGKAGVTAAS